MISSSKKIYLVIGDGFNRRFNFHTSYFDFLNYRYKNDKELCDLIALTNGNDDYDKLVDFVISHYGELSLWDYYYLWDINFSKDLREQQINFETIQSLSFTSGFWRDVTNRIINETSLKADLILNNQYSFKDFINETYDAGEESLKDIHKINFFASFLILKYEYYIKKSLRTNKSVSKEETYSYIWEELKSFEKEYGMFVSLVDSSAVKSSEQLEFIEKIKSIIESDLKQQCEIQVFSFNYNPLSIDVSNKYHCEYLHGNTSCPIFSGIEHAEMDECSYTNIFDGTYQREIYGLRHYSELFEKGDNVIAFYGLSFTPEDLEEFEIIHSYRLKTNPIYHFYSDYEGGPSLAERKKQLYNNFYSNYFKLASIDEFYKKMKSHCIIMREV